MAKVQITAVKLDYDVATPNAAISSGDAINPSNQMLISYPVEGKLLLALNNTAATAKVFTIVAGDKSFPASGQGNISISIAQNEVKYIVVSSSRFINSFGQIEISFEAGTTGFVKAFQLP